MENLRYSHIKNILIERYASKDELRPRYCQPCDHKSYWCITDGYIALMIPHELIGKANNEDIGYGGVLEGLNELPKPILFALNEVKQALSKCISEPGYDEEYKECDVCEGYGSTDEDDICIKCDGEGELLLSKKATGRLHYCEFDDKGVTQSFRLHQALFYPNIINRVVEAIELLRLQDSIIQLTHNSVDRGSVFQVGDVKILFMPQMADTGNIVKAELGAVKP